MKILFWIVSAIFAVVLSGRQVDASVRDAIKAEAPATEDDPSFPNIWEVIEGSYDTDVLVTLPDAYPSGVSLFVEELYEVTEAKGSVKVTDHGEYEHYNYYSASNQMFYVKKMMCQVQGLLDHPGYHFYGWTYEGEDGSEDNFVFGPSALLRASHYNTPTFVAQNTTRGIDSDEFTVTLPDGYIISYFFSTDAWTMPYGHHLEGKDYRSPLRITVKGKQKDPWDPDSTETDMTVYYDYIEFNPYAAPEHFRDFLVEKGVECKNAVTLDPNKVDPPPIPNNFKVQMEYVLHRMDVQDIYRSWMYYDGPRKLVRMDENTNDEFQLSYNTRHVHDYNTGVAHIINEATGTCRIEPIRTGSFGTMGGIAGGVILADPDHIFHLDDSYLFTGYSETRGILTERWTSTRSDIPNYEANGFYTKVVVDFQFLRDVVVDVGEASQRRYPVRMDLTVYDNEQLDRVLYEEAINFLGFSSEEDVFLIDEFDVRECYTLPQQHAWLKITFEGIWDYGINTHTQEFTQELLEFINHGYGVSFVRMPELQIDHDENFVFAILLLLEPPPYLLQFTKNPDKKPTTQDSKMPEAISDANFCARYCLSYKTFECKSFYECKGLGQNCFLSSVANSTGEVAVSQECAHYVYSLEEEKYIQRANREVEMWIDAQIVAGDLKFTFEYVDQNNVTKEGTYRATRMERELVADDPLLVDYIRDDFQPLEYGARIKDKFVTLTLTVDDYAECLGVCLGYEAFRCETFSYCYNDGSCKLSETIFVRPMTSGEVAYQGDCNVISRQLISDYTHVQGAVLIADVNQEVDDIFDPNYCAYLCDMAEDFVCRSFDFCEDTNVCYMHETHALDSGSGGLQLNATHCSHYSRDYLVDFEQHQNVRLSGTRDVYIADIPVDQCAKECVEQPDLECNGFDYCVEDELTTTCFLTADQYSGSGVSVSNDDTCDHYERVYFNGEDINTIVNKHKSSSKKSYGPGDMAGLALGMLVSTVALCFVGFYLYNRPS